MESKEADCYKSNIGGENGEKCYRTSTGRCISMKTDFKLLYSLNLLCGDVLEIKSSKKLVEVVGFAENRVWVKPQNSPTIFALPGYEINQIFHKLTLKERKDHEIKEIKYGKSQILVDITPKFCSQFGYEPGDLIWYKDHGITEFIGMYANKMIISLCGTSKILQIDVMNYKILRRMSTNLQYKYEFMNTNGEQIVLDILMNPRLIFQPMDRVMSPFGEATIIGYNKSPYIQTDEMKFNGSDAIESNVFDLTLLRRVNMNARRKIIVEEDSVSISLNTSDSVNDLLPGDCISVNSCIQHIVGFTDDKKIVIHSDFSQPYKFLAETNFHIVYRADIAARRLTSEASIVSVGSPSLLGLCIIPGDIVKIKDKDEELEYYGINECSPVFVSKQTKDVQSFSFSILLIPDFFTLVKRTALMKYQK